MKAVDLFRKFQDAQQTPGDFAYFALLFSYHDIGGVQHVSSAFPGQLQLSLLTSMVEKGNPAIGIIGIPSFDGLKHGQQPYVEKLSEESWVPESLNENVEHCIWMIEHNPPQPQK